MTAAGTPLRLKLLLCRYHLVDPWTFHYKLSSQLYKEILSYINNPYFVALKIELRVYNTFPYKEYLRPVTTIETRVYKCGARLILGPSYIRDDSLKGTYSIQKEISLHNGDEWGVLDLSYLQAEDNNRLSILMCKPEGAVTDRMSINSEAGRQFITKYKLQHFFEGLIQPEGFDDPIPFLYWWHKDTILNLGGVTALAAVVKNIDTSISNWKQNLPLWCPYMIPYASYKTTLKPVRPDSELAIRLLSLYEFKGYTLEYSNPRVENGEDLVDIHITCPERHRRQQMGLPNAPKHFGRPPPVRSLPGLPVSIGSRPTLPAMPTLVEDSFAQLETERGRIRQQRPGAMRIEFSQTTPWRNVIDSMGGWKLR